MESTHIEKVNSYIHAHLKEEFSLSQIAEHAGYSAFHLAREYKAATGLSVMEYALNQRIMASSKALADNRSVCEVAMEYGFETHAGYTKAFTSVYGCTPRQFQEHSNKIKNSKGAVIMSNSKIVIRHICRDDVQDLWENVYSAMTPRQITEDKILPAIEAYKRREGLELVAEVDGKVVMSLPMTKPTWVPIGFVWDNNFVLTGGESDRIMGMLVEEMKKQAKALGIGTLLSPQGKDSESSRAMQSLGFQKVKESGDWEYLMMSI